MKTRRFRMWFAVCLVTVAVLAGLVGACAEPAPSPAPPAPAPAPAPEPPAPPTPEVIELSVATTTPSMAPPSAAVTAWARKFEEASGGRVKFTIYYASSLCEAKEVLTSILAGVADISDYWITVDPGIMKLNSVTYLPFLGWSDPVKATVIWRELLYGPKFPELLAEYQGLKVIYPTLWGQTTTYLNTTKEMVKTKDDFKGQKIGGSGGYVAKWQSAMGASPVFVAFEDTYMSLERGLIDGHFGTFGWQEGSGVIELTPYHTVLGANLDLGFNPLIMNPDSWNRLPPDIQKIFDDLDDFYTELRIGGELDREPKYVKITKEEMGHTYYTLPPEELQSWIDVAKPIHEEWITEMEEAGLPGRALYEELQRLTKE